MLTWVAAVVVALLVLGIVGYGLAGAFGRLLREVQGAQRDLEPLLQQARTVAVTRSE
jgi:hypothetical protein